MSDKNKQSVKQAGGWTAEPWEMYANGANGYHIRQPGSQIPIGGAMLRRDAERMRDCVNALAGIPNPAAVGAVVAALKVSMAVSAEAVDSYLLRPCSSEFCSGTCHRCAGLRRSQAIRDAARAALARLDEVAK
jgi:hypothetical protein